jgi:hypothetical protein
VVLHVRAVLLISLLIVHDYSDDAFSVGRRGSAESGSAIVHRQFGRVLNPKSDASFCFTWLG